MKPQLPAKLARRFAAERRELATQTKRAANDRYHALLENIIEDARLHGEPFSALMLDILEPWWQNRRRWWKARRVERPPRYCK